ncbi:MAG: PadR family transcriptional regulator [Candidatus Micrarchaeota archaeon]|nr:PadR family transcriptional regulator [Candidatus Micrarchaeota archaeon]
MRRQILKLILLRRIKAGSIYSYAIMKELDNAHISALLLKGNGSVKSDIYNTINMLEKSGYIRMRAKTSGGRTKKYYSLTPKGNKVLVESKRLFLSSMKELMRMLE